MKSSSSTIIVSPKKERTIIPQRKDDYTSVARSYISVSERFYDVSDMKNNNISSPIVEKRSTTVETSAALCLKLDSDYPLEIGQEMIFTSAFTSNDNYFLVDVDHPSNIKFMIGGIYSLEIIATLEGTSQDFIEGNVSFYNSSASDDLNAFNTETFDLRNRFLHLKTICSIKEGEVVNLLFEFRQQILVLRGAKYLITKISA
jgi:hypothetical protein